MTDSLDGRRIRGVRKERRLSSEEEARFQEAYRLLASELKLNPDPDDPRHFYRHRAAWKAGMLSHDSSGHGSSKFKRVGHPNLIVDGIDTRTGKQASQRLINRNKRVFQKTILAVEKASRRR